MPRDTSSARDVHIFISVPCGSDAECETDPSRCAPWDAPISRDTGGRAALLKQLLERAAPLLEVLQAGHRAGQLAQDDLDELASLQRWYSCLQAESERTRPAPPSPGK